MFLVCGEALFDLFMTGTPEYIDMFKARHGGSPYNVAVGIARLGTSVGFFSGISYDRLGQQIAAALTLENVSTSYIVRKAAPTTLSLVMLGDAGVPSYAFYGDGAADRALTPEDLPVLADDVAGLHFGSYALVCEPAASCYFALAQREAGRRLISIDPNVRLNVEPDVTLWRDRVIAWVRCADVVKVSVEDLERLYPGVDMLTIARAWLVERPALVVITKGGDGAVAVTATMTVETLAPVVTVIDTVGAGDAFQAALLHQLYVRGCTGALQLKALSGPDLESILRFACMAGGLACTRQGADLPRAEEILKALER
ncbi:MAG: hypothetical protein B7Z80_20035 [Rhodospirillales bacterium 20-64-7]|nr:MAG: hypothetical protein B7Z80_20035 [Rhodospirillales bacterium 20-64-7]